MNEAMVMQSELEIVIAGKKNEFIIMLVIPFVIIWYMRLCSSELFFIMYEALLGKLIMTIALITYFGAAYIGNRIINER